MPVAASLLVSGAHPVMRKRVLLVEPDPPRLLELARAIPWVATVDSCAEFSTARERLLAHPPDLLVTNVRLRAHNGLHLVYLAQMSGLPTRAIIYSSEPDQVLLREAQAAGAFVETPRRLPSALVAYLRGMLPARDRRDVSVFDRRQLFRGGCRAPDLAAVM